MASVWITDDVIVRLAAAAVASSSYVIAAHLVLRPYDDTSDHVHVFVLWSFLAGLQLSATAYCLHHDK